MPADDWEVDVDGMAQHKYFKQCLTSYKISSDQPDVARACLQAILKAAVGHRKGIEACHIFIIVQSYGVLTLSFCR